MTTAYAPQKKISSFHPPQRTLLGPGPSEINPRVLAASSLPAIGYLDPIFVEMMDELKQLLLADKDQLARALTTRLLTYATGARPTPADQPQIDAIVSEIQVKDYGLRSLVHEIVQSKAFRNK